MIHLQFKLIKSWKKKKKKEMLEMNVRIRDSSPTVQVIYFKKSMSTKRKICLKL